MISGCLAACTIGSVQIVSAEVEKKAYEAWLLLKADLEENDGIYLELDSARRSIAEQQDIMDRFIVKYGQDYADKTVAQPGYSEHHTGLALDLYFKVKGDDGEFTDVYHNEDMEKEEYKGVWETIHSKLADYGFILRYLEGKEHITGYRYEPWHIRYAGDESDSEENRSWLSSLSDGKEYTHAVEFLMDFHTAEDLQGAWEPDYDYQDYQWWLAYTEDNGWEIVSWGY